jgi:hypothetical protein
MALIRCPDCRRKVSDMAVACPSCARPIAGTEVGAQPAQLAPGGEREPKPRSQRRTPPSVRPAPHVETNPSVPEDATRLALPTFKVTCSMCNVADSLLYPRNDGDYVCPECRESAVVRAWARRGILQWLPLALGILALVAASAVAYWRLAPPRQHNPIMPYSPQTDARQRASATRSPCVSTRMPGPAAATASTSATATSRASIGR